MRDRAALDECALRLSCGRAHLARRELMQSTSEVLIDFTSRGTPDHPQIVRIQSRCTVSLRAAIYFSVPMNTG